MRNRTLQQQISRQFIIIRNIKIQTITEQVQIKTNIELVCLFPFQIRIGQTSSITYGNTTSIQQVIP